MLQAVGTGLAMVGSLQQGAAAASSNNQQAQLAEQRAYIGRIKANQTDTQFREELSTTLANIDGIRAAANTVPGATSMAIRENEKKVSGRQRRTSVFNVMSQVTADEMAADIYAANARSALMAGGIGAATAGVNGLTAMMRQGFA
jgi:hypothetical protein